MKIASKEQILEIEKAAKEMREKIRNSESDYPKGTPTYYVDSENGCDEFDGKTPETAWRSCDKVGMADLKPGDVVLFRRGGVYRGTLLTVRGVTYSAYGEGPKPELLGSIDASDPSLWIPTPTKNVWRYKNRLGYVIDVGGIFFNDGSISSPRSAEDKDDVTYDNLAFKYCNFGIGGFGGAKNLTVRNCEFIGIGGAQTQPDWAKNKPHTPEDRDACRYGNAIEIYGICDGYYVENCCIERD